MAEIVDYPTPELALQAVIEFATANRLTPAQLVSIVLAGGASHRGLLVCEEDRIPGLRLDVMYCNQGPKPEAIDWEAVSQRIGWAR